MGSPIRDSQSILYLELIPNPRVERASTCKERKDTTPETPNNSSLVHTFGITKLGVVHSVVQSAVQLVVQMAVLLVVPMVVPRVAQSAVLRVVLSAVEKVVLLVAEWVDLSATKYRDMSQSVQSQRL